MNEVMQTIIRDVYDRQDFTGGLNANEILGDGFGSDKGLLGTIVDAFGEDHNEVAAWIWDEIVGDDAEFSDPGLILEQHKCE